MTSSGSSICSCSFHTEGWLICELLHGWSPSINCSSFCCGKNLVTSFGKCQQARVFSSGTGGCAAFLANYDVQPAATVLLYHKHYDLPPWSISILPNCKTDVFNTAKVRDQNSLAQMLPVNSKFSVETYDEDLSSLDESSRITTSGLLEQLNVTRDDSNYLWYITSVDISSSESFLRGGHKPNINVQSAGHVVHVFVNGQSSGQLLGQENREAAHLMGQSTYMLEQIKLHFSA